MAWWKVDAEQMGRWIALKLRIDPKVWAYWFDVPTLIIHGTEDAIVPFAGAEWLATQIPNNRFVRLEGTGHVPTMTRAGEVARAIDEFFPVA